MGKQEHTTLKSAIETRWKAGWKGAIEVCVAAMVTKQLTWLKMVCSFAETGLPLWELSRNLSLQNRSACLPPMMSKHLSSTTTAIAAEPETSRITITGLLESSATPNANDKPRQTCFPHLLRKSQFRKQSKALILRRVPSQVTLTGPKITDASFTWQLATIIMSKLSFNALVYSMCSRKCSVTSTSIWAIMFALCDCPIFRSNYSRVLCLVLPVVFRLLVCIPLYVSVPNWKSSKSGHSNCLSKFLSPSIYPALFSSFAAFRWKMPGFNLYL